MNRHCRNNNYLVFLPDGTSSIFWVFKFYTSSYLFSDVLVLNLVDILVIVLSLSVAR
jgi:hypothetical protein